MTPQCSQWMFPPLLCSGVGSPSTRPLGARVCQVSSDWCLAVTLQWVSVESPANWEMPPMALPLVDNSPLARRAVSPFTLSLDSSLRVEFLSSLSWVSAVRRDASFRISFSRSWSTLLTLTVCSA
eukprot:Gb_39078 [translate_table: standard]